MSDPDGSSESTIAQIALGGNLGDVAARFERAARLLEEQGDRVTAVSEIVRTPAVGDAAGDEFCNAAATVNTSKSASEFLDSLHRIERRFGRTRDVHWGPRTIDLDLILFGDEIHHNALTVPHPAAWYRRFVLDPLVTIAPDAVFPDRGSTVAECRRRLLQRPLPIAVVPHPAESEHATRTEDALRVIDRFSEAELTRDITAAALIVLVDNTPRKAGLPPATLLDLSTSVDIRTDLRNVILSALP